MEEERTDAEWLSEAKASLEDLISWSDEFPNEFITGNPRHSRNKFRNNWFQGATSNILLVADILEDEQLKQDTNHFKSRRRRRNENDRNTKEEINEVDQLIRRALEKLKNIS